MMKYLKNIMTFIEGYIKKQAKKRGLPHIYSTAFSEKYMKKSAKKQPQFPYFLFITILTCNSANARFISTHEGDISDLPEGKVIEEGAVGSRVEVVWTNTGHAVITTLIDGKSEVVDKRDEKIKAKNPGDTRGTVEMVPQQKLTIITGTDDQGQPITKEEIVHDFKQTITSPDPKNPTDPAVSDLHVVAQRQLGNDFLVTPYLLFLKQRLGSFGILDIPDLFADTNRDGMVGDGDTLYAVVNIVDFTEHLITFDFGNSFQIINGTSSGLPGFLFSDMPIIPDESSSTGFLNSSPITTTGFVGAKHTIAVIPEPNTLMLLLVGVAGLMLGRKLYRQ